MTKVQIPGIVRGLTVRPPLPPDAPLSDYVQQALAVLLGYTYGETVALRASPAGVLYVAEPRTGDTFQWTATGDNESHQGSDIVCTQLLIVTPKGNTDTVYVRTGKAATTSNSIPMSASQALTLSVENLKELRVLIAKTSDMLSVTYSL